MMNRKISIVGVPMDLGQGRRGVDMGPNAIRYAGVIEQLEQLGFEIEDLGDVAIHRPKTTIDESTGLKNLEAVIAASQSIAEKVESMVQRESFPLILGGDHSISIGTLAGIAKFYENLGVIWYDAHTDINTPETSPSGNIHGMPLAVSLGLGEERLVSVGGYSPKIKPENIVFIGARSIDDGEKELIKKLGIKVYTMRDIEHLGMPTVIKETIEYLKPRTDGLHLSFDLDALDKLFAPGVGTPVMGGVSLRESHLALEMLAKEHIVTSAEFVEVNPILDERNKTGELAVDLIATLFGKTLL